MAFLVVASLGSVSSDSLSALRRPFPRRWGCFCCSNGEAKRACPGSWGEGGRQRTWLLRAEGKGLRFSCSRLRGALEAYTRHRGRGGQQEPQVWARGSNSSEAPWASLLEKIVNTHSPPRFGVQILADLHKWEGPRCLQFISKEFINFAFYLSVSFHFQKLKNYLPVKQVLWEVALYNMKHCFRAKS